MKTSLFTIPFNYKHCEIEVEAKFKNPECLFEMEKPNCSILMQLGTYFYRMTETCQH